jgi:hypothetical protein
MKRRRSAWLFFHTGYKLDVDAGDLAIWSMNFGAAPAQSATTQLPVAFEATDATPPGMASGLRRSNGRRNPLKRKYSR